MSRVCVKSGRYTWCTVIFFAGFLLLCGRLFFLQVVEAEAIAAEVESSRQRLEKLEAKRGDILDRNGDLLAGTRSRIDLGVDPSVVDTLDEEKLALLAGILDLPFEDLKAAFLKKERIDSSGETRAVRWVKLAEIGEDLFASVQELNLKEVYGVRRYERYYPGKELAAHLIGFINKEQTPVMGVERTLDYYLRGQSGWRETEVDGRREELAAFRDREVAPRNGMHVQLTIDLFVQSALETALQELVAETQPEGATIIVSDPQHRGYPWPGELSRPLTRTPSGTFPLPTSATVQSPTSMSRARPSRLCRSGRPWRRALWMPIR
jgi:cell division protein FtsI/penicillin-binding protein 2